MSRKIWKRGRLETIPKILGLFEKEVLKFHGRPWFCWSQECPEHAAKSGPIRDCVEIRKSSQLLQYRRPKNKSSLFRLFLYAAHSGPQDAPESIFGSQILNPPSHISLEPNKSVNCCVVHNFEFWSSDGQAAVETSHFLLCAIQIPTISFKRQT